MAKTDSSLLGALRKKLGKGDTPVSQQAVQQRRARLQRLVPMPTDIATYVVAQREGIRLDRFIENQAVLQAVAEADARLRAIESSEGMPSSSTPRAKRSATTARVTKVSIGVTTDADVPALNPSHAREAKAMAERVYPMLYIFENSVRDLIERVLGAKYGDRWWHTAVPARVRQVATNNKKSESADAWHGRRGARDVDYVYLRNLWDIVNKCWPDFKELFPNKAWMEHLITNDMNVSRNVIAHMNPLDADDVKNIEAAYKRWVKQLKAVEDNLP